MSRHAFVVVVLVLLSLPARLFGQSVTLNGSLNVASAQDFASRVLQAPWDMNERTDFGWFLNGSDSPSPDLTNVQFSGGIFSATTGTSPNLFLLETPVPTAARLGKTGGNYPIDANTYRLFAIRMNINGSPQGILTWNRDNLWDGTSTSSNTFPPAGFRNGWAVYLVDLPTLGTRAGPLSWNGLIKSLQFYPSYLTPYNLQIDWIRLVDVDPLLCRSITWSGFAGAVDLYLDVDATPGNGNESFLAGGVTDNTASAGCPQTGTGYNFYAGALSPGTYRVLARPAGGTGSFTQSGNAYQVNDIPLLTITAPSDEGSADDFATTQLGNAWDMKDSTDVDQFFNVTSPNFNTPISAETPAGVSLGSVTVLSAQSTPAAPPAGDPRLAVLWQQRGQTVRIDPLRYRILTVEFGLPNVARSMVGGSVARVLWRVVGSTDSVSDDIVVNSRVGANVMDKVTLDMADRAVLPIVQGSTIGWVPGSLGQGIDLFQFKPHEFPAATPFYVRRIKLAALERVAVGANYTVQWTASKSSGTVTVYYDTDRDPSNGRTLIGSVPTAGGSIVWTPNVTPGEYFISVDINDGQGNSNTVYSRWPIAVDPAPPPPPSNFRIIG